MQSWNPCRSDFRPKTCQLHSSRPPSRRKLSKIPFVVTESRLWGNISPPVSQRTPLRGVQPSSSDFHQVSSHVNITVHSHLYGPVGRQTRIIKSNFKIIIIKLLLNLISFNPIRHPMGPCRWLSSLFTKGETNLVKTPWSCLFNSYQTFLVYLQEVHFTLFSQCELRPLPFQFILFFRHCCLHFPASRNCFIHPLHSIHCVIRATSSGLFIIASNDLSFACRRTLSLPLAHCGHANCMCLTFYDGYPHWQRGFSTPGTFLL